MPTGYLTADDGSRLVSDSGAALYASSQQTYEELVAEAVASYLTPGSGDSVTDQSGNGRDAAWVGTPAYTDAPYGRAAVFDGANSYLSVASPAAFTGDYTIFMRAKADAEQTETNGGLFRDTDTGLWVDKTTGNIWGRHNNSNVAIQGTGLSLEGRGWVGFALRYSTDTGKAGLYTETGELHTEVTTGADSWAFNLIGRQNSSSFLGEITEVVAFDRALAPSEIATLGGGLHGVYEDLVAEARHYWGGSLTDSGSTGGQDATASGGVSLGDPIGTSPNQAWDFDGTDDLLEIPDGVTLGLPGSTGGFAMSALIEADSQTGNTVIAETGGFTQGQSLQEHNGVIYGVVVVAGVPQVVSYPAPQGVAYGVVMTVDIDAGTITLAVNGLVVDTLAGVNFSLRSSAGSNAGGIGGSPSDYTGQGGTGFASGGYFDGRITDVGIWDRALGPNEAATVSAGPAVEPPTYEGLVAEAVHSYMPAGGSDTPDDQNGSANAVWTGTPTYRDAPYGRAFDTNAARRLTAVLPVDYATTEFTAFARVYQDVTGLAYPFGQSTGINNGWQFRCDPDGGHVRPYVDSAVSTDRQIDGYTTGVWQALSVRSDGTVWHGRMAGVETGPHATASDGSTTSLSIGSRNGALIFDGAIAELLIFDRELSADEIATLEAGPTASATNPVNDTAPVIAEVATDFELSSAGVWSEQGTNFALTYQWQEDDGGWSDLVGQTATTLATAGLVDSRQYRLKETGTSDEGTADAFSNTLTYTAPAPPPSTPPAMIAPLVHPLVAEIV